MNYKFIRIRAGFWIVVNLYGERLAEANSLSEAREIAAKLAR